MRRDVLDLRAFYASPLGEAVRDLVRRKLVEAWGDAHGLDVLGVGYATPFVEPFTAAARRVVAAMPGEQGVERWPAEGGGRACLTGETRLPFPNALFDRVLVIHGLEESDDLEGFLDEMMRVLSPSGRIILAVASRRGLWAGSEATPFGYGRPFTRTQLEEAVVNAGLEPTAWSRCLYAPPFTRLAPYAEAFEQVGSLLVPPLSGLILLEAVKQTFAVKPKGARAPAFAPGALRPATAGVARGRQGAALLSQLSHSANISAMRRASGASSHEVDHSCNQTQSSGCGPRRRH